MRHAILLAASLLAMTTAFAAEPKRFIPWSPLDPEIKAGMKERHWKKTTLTDAQVDELLGDIREYHTLRERDILAAYPELRGGRKLSSCSNRIMSGATSIVFLSDVGDHVVTVKKLSCDRAIKEGGVRCGSVTTSKDFFLKSPRESISLIDVSPEAAMVVAQTYDAQRVDGLPEWIAGHFPKLKIIKALPDDHFHLYMGDVICDGCYARYEVRLDTSADEPRLIYAGNGDSGCF